MLPATNTNEYFIRFKEYVPTSMEKGLKRKSQMNKKLLKTFVAGVALVVSGMANAGLITVSQQLSGGPDETTLNFAYDLSSVDWSQNQVTFAEWVIGSTINDSAGDDFFEFEGVSFGTSTFTYSNGESSEGNYFFDVTSLVVSELLSSTIMNATIVTSDYDGFWDDSVTWYTKLNVTYENKFASEVPEPSTLAIFALGFIGLASRKLNKRA